VCILLCFGLVFMYICAYRFVCVCMCLYFPSFMYSLIDNRALKEFSSVAHIGKLCAKHKNIADQARFLKETKVRVVVGTPNRMHRLVDDGSLSLDRVKVFLIDMAFNVKMFTVISSKDIKKQFFQLYHDHVHERVMSGRIKICLF